MTLKGGNLQRHFYNRSTLSISLISSAIICYFLFGSSSGSFAQNDNPASPANLHQWGAVTLFHGLPSNHVRAIAQDTDGTFWFGTDGGLTKYDGRRIEKVTIEGLAFTRVLTLHRAAQGELWIGTDNGAARFAGQQFRVIKETSGKSISAIVSNEQGRFALASEQGFIFDCAVQKDEAITCQTIEPATNPLLADAAGLGLHLTSLAFWDNTLLVGTQGRGIISIERGEVKELKIQPRPFFIEAITADSQNRLWVGAQAKDSHNGLYKLEDLSRAAKIAANTDTATAIKFDAQEKLWAGTQNQGVFVFKENQAIEHFTFENTAGGLRSNNIYTIFIDREGVVWLGTDRGVCRYDPKGMRVETISPFVESNFVRVLFHSADDLLWCGTNRGLFVRAQTAALWQEVKELAGKSVYAMHEDAEQRLFVGTNAGLYEGSKDRRFASRYFTGSRAFVRNEAEILGELSGDSIRALCRFQNAIYLASFANGVERLDGNKRTLVFPVEASDSRKRQVVSLFADKAERLFIGTADAGVFLFDGKQTIRDRRLERLNNNAVWSFAETRDGVMWLATNEGLFVLANDKLTQVIEGTEARSVVVANEASHLVWCATAGNGLYKILLNQRANPVVSRFDTEQGLPSQKVFAVLPTDNEVLWIGTNDGAVRYETNKTQPAIKLSRVIGNRAYQPQEIEAGLNLEYPQNSLLVEATAIGSRTFPEQFQYDFTIVDATGKVVAQKLSRDSQMLMQDLRNGNYKLSVCAFTNDLIASQFLTINFAVQRAPFPWTSTGLAILLLLALLAIWWGYRQNFKIARSHEALALSNQQLAETRMQLANETETERRRIARDLHDQTLADLRRLMMLTDQLPANEKSNGKINLEPKIFRGEIESISSEIRRICEDLSPSVLENVGFAAALEWALTDVVAHLPEGKKFEYEFSCVEAIEEKINIPSVMQIHIYRIAQEVLNNISRHADATRVRLNARLDANNDFILEIEDNGRGFDLESSSKSGRGIANIRTRASLIDAEVNWLRQASGGTLFLLNKTAASDTRR